jgi:transposase-like protein
MKGTAQRYSPEFKQAVIAQAQAGGKSMAELERELGLRAGIVKKWVYRQRAGGAAGQGGGGGGALSLSERQELEQLREQKLRLECEVEVLKKAIEICSRR